MIKEWIIETFFQDEWDEAKRQGSIDAFEKAREDLEETNTYDVEKKVEVLTKKKLNDLLSSVDLNFVVTLDKTRGVIYIGGEKADELRLSNLKAEAEFFAQSDLWKIIYNSPKRLAEKAMFADDGKLETQLIKGRAMMYLLDTQKNIVEVLKGFVIKK